MNPAPSNIQLYIFERNNNLYFVYTKVLKKKELEEGAG